MKSLQCVFFVAAALVHISSAHIDLPPELEKMIADLRGPCIAESGVDEALVKAAENMDIQSDPNLKCFFKCMMTKMHCMNDDGVFDEEAVMASIPDEIKNMGVQDVIDKCKHLKGEDKCDTAYELVNCFAKNAEALAELFS